MNTQEHLRFHEPSNAEAPPARRRERALASLRENVLSNNFFPSDGDPACGLVNGDSVPLPAYIPYVGPAYFDYRPRILCYAINQNLSQHASWSDKLTTDWASDIEYGIDRMNRSAADGQSIPILPYAEGYIPLAALIAISDHAPKYGYDLPDVVEDVIAVTNFVKFSTVSAANSSGIPLSWWRECGSRYVSEEIMTLKPDIVMSVGRKTDDELRRVIKTLPFRDASPRLLHCPFPKYSAIKARPVSDDEQATWHRIQLLAKRIKPLPSGYRHKHRMLKFPGYFLDIEKAWRR